MKRYGLFVVIFLSGLLTVRTGYGQDLHGKKKPQADSRGKLKGKVIWEGSREQVEFCKIYLMQKGKIITGAYSDDLGRYTIANLSPGTYDLIADYWEETTTLHQVRIEAGKTHEIEIFLREPSPCLCGQDPVIYRPPELDLLEPSGRTMNRSYIREVSR